MFVGVEWRFGPLIWVYLQQPKFNFFRHSIALIFNEQQFLSNADYLYVYPIVIQYRLFILEK